MKCVLAIVILMTTFTQAMATPNIYVKKSDSWFSQLVMVKGSKEVKFTGPSDEVQELFKDNALSYKYIQEADENMTKFNISLWGGLGLALLYLFSNSDDDFNSGIYWGIFGAGVVGSVYYGAQAQHKFLKAVNTYNGVPDEMSFRQNPAQGPKLSYSWQF